MSRPETAEGAEIRSMWRRETAAGAQGSAPHVAPRGGCVGRTGHGSRVPPGAATGAYDAPMPSRRSVTVWVLSAALLGAAAGCGGGGDDQSASSSSGGSPPQESGKELFTHTCAGCHTLKDAGTNGQVGPDLDEIAPSKALVLATLRAGPGAMPENLLVGAEADRVATYVSGVAGE